MDHPCCPLGRLERSFGRIPRSRSERGRQISRFPIVKHCFCSINMDKRASVTREKGERSERMGETCSSPSLSTSLIISSTSSSVNLRHSQFHLSLLFSLSNLSPIVVMKCLNSCAVMKPFPSLSNTLEMHINQRLEERRALLSLSPRKGLSLPAITQTSTKNTKKGLT